MKATRKLDELGQGLWLFQPIRERTAGVGRVGSLEVSPLLAHDAESTPRAAKVS